MQVGGAEPLGVEIPRKARDSVRKHLGLPVYENLPEELAQNGPVDAILLNDVVERLVAPADLPGTAVTALRAGGMPSGDPMTALCWYVPRLRQRVGRLLGGSGTSSVTVPGSDPPACGEARPGHRASRDDKVSGLGIDRAPKALPSLRTSLQEARTAVSSSPVWP
jgi:hypothetical protein